MTVKSDGAQAAGDLQELLKRRTAPAIYVIDREARVVMSWPAGDGTLPAEIDDAVRELQWALLHGAESPLVRLLDRSYVVRVAALAGELGAYAAVSVERFKMRDSANGRSYALTERERDVLAAIVAAADADSVASELNLSPAVVAQELASIVTKTAPGTRTELFERVIGHAADFRHDAKAIAAGDNADGDGRST